MSARPVILGAAAAILIATVVLAVVARAPHVRYRLTVDSMNAPSPHAPSSCGTEGRDRVVVVALGDSITRGAVGRDFVADARNELPPGYVLINAGVNGDRTAGALARLDAVVACRPDAVAILIGANDVLFGPEGEAALQAYRRDLDAIVSRLAVETGARIAVFSLPLIGEDPASAYNARGAAYSAVARDVAAERGAAYLPLRERQLEALARLPPYMGPACADAAEIERSMERGWWLYYSGRQPDWERVAAEQGVRLTVDCVHLSAIGAAPAGELLLAFVMDAL
jgi:lysophospholipase L1-like esterase